MIKTDAPITIITPLPDCITEQEAYEFIRKINEEDKEHHAKLENGKLKVQQVLRG